MGQNESRSGTGFGISYNLNNKMSNKQKNKKIVDLIKGQKVPNYYNYQPLLSLLGFSGSNLYNEETYKILYNLAKQGRLTEEIFESYK